MKIVRGIHMPTLLQNGQELVAGGITARTTFAGHPRQHYRERRIVYTVARDQDLELIGYRRDVPVAAVRGQRHSSLLASAAVLEIPRHWGVAAR
jgi:hypothetical protein